MNSSSDCVVWVVGYFSDDRGVSGAREYRNWLEEVSENSEEAIVKVADPSGEKCLKCINGEYKGDGYIDWEDCVPK